MGALVGLGVGVGLMLIWSAFFVPRHARPSGRAPGGTARLLERAGLGSVSPASFAVLCLVCAVVAGTVVQVVSGTAPVAVVFGALGGYLPVAVVAGRAHRRQRELAEVWPEAVDNLASAVRAGLSLPDALAGLSVRGPEPLREAFEGFALDYQVTGRFSESLDRLKDRLADPVGDRVVEGLRVAREVGGGDLGRLLRNLSGYLRDDVRTRSELEARQAWAVNGARLAVAVAVGGAAADVAAVRRRPPLRLARRRRDPGRGARVLCVVAYRLMMRIGRLPVERRILADGGGAT